MPNEGGLPNRLGSASGELNKLKSDAAVPLFFEAEKQAWGAIMGVYNVEGTIEEKDTGLRQLIGMNIKVLTSEGKEIKVRSPFNYNFITSTIGTPGNLLGKLVRIDYKGSSIYDIEKGNLVFLDDPSEKQEEVRIAQPICIGGIFGNMGGDLSCRKMIFEFSESHGEMKL